MNMIRTTISLREDLYNNLKRLALNKRVSLSGIINARLIEGNNELSKIELERKAKGARAFFAKLARKATIKIDSAQAIREMRDERLNQLAGE